MSQNWQPSADIETLKKRARILQNIRAFFVEKNVLEIEVPTLTSASVTEVHIDSIPVELFSGQAYMQTSPEYPMKRLLAAGMGDCFYLGKVFRQGESGGRHNPEFTMLEWYRLGFGIEELSQEVISLVETLLDVPCETQELTYAEAVSEYTGLGVFNSSIQDIKSVLHKYHIAIPDKIMDDHDIYLDLLVSTLVFPKLRSLTPDKKLITVINDYPISQAALAKIRMDEKGRKVAARFEVFVDGMEIANGYHEIQDAELLKKRFIRDNNRRKKLGKTEMPIDDYLLEAMHSGLPDCSGVALGVDRLMMLAMGKSTIQDVISFPLEQC